MALVPRDDDDFFFFSGVSFRTALHCLLRSSGVRFRSFSRRKAAEEKQKRAKRKRVCFGSLKKSLSSAVIKYPCFDGLLRWLLLKHCSRKYDGQSSSITMTYRSYLLPNLQDHPSQQGMAEVSFFHDKYK